MNAEIKIDYAKTLDTGLYLDTLNKVIKWSCTPDELLSEIGETKYVMNKSDYMDYTGYGIQSGIFGILRSFSVLFNFINGKLTSININELSDMDVITNFNRIRNELEPILGKPNRSLCLFNLKKQSCKWKLKKVIIEQSIIERDGLQRIFEIKIR